ncbi:hypothetical protein BC833DRAFT_597146 [Globomyces pollinis-pini]|nr:hypothetical protein BC833DRAFT_597146 [Globomyces pollinis-pini]
MVKILLLDQRLDPSIHNNQSLVVALQQGYQDIVTLLLEDSRINPTGQDSQSFIIALHGGNTKLSSVL